MYSHNYIRNGLHVFSIFWFMLLFTHDMFLSSIVSLKAFSTNYWYHFHDSFDYNIPVKYNQIKQVVRFTDTGHLASFIYYFYPEFFPIAFNVHFAITSVYWIAVKCFDMKDTDSVDDDKIIVSIQNTAITLMHGLPLILLVFEYINKHPCDNCFSNTDLYYSYTWLYAWFFTVYLPWRYITGDPVYSILSRGTPVKTIARIAILMHISFFVGNSAGRFMCQIS